MIALVVLTLLGGTTAQKPEKVAFSFDGVEYFHRYSKGNLHEFTPKGQSNLDTWTEMVTINDYATVKTGDDLAKSANSVLTTYKDHKAIVVKTDSVPRTAKKEAEHLIVVMFPTQKFIESTFARFLMSNGKGISIVYSHRIYGKAAGDPMSQWLLKHGEVSEKALMALSPVPKH